MTPPENTPVNISGKIVIISNLIQLQKAVREIDPDLLFGRIHAEDHGLHEGDEDFLPVPVRHEQVPVAHREDAGHTPDDLPVLRQERAPDDLEVVKTPLFRRAQGLLGDIYVRPGEGVRLRQGVDARELQERGIPVEPQRFDRVLFEFLSPLKKDCRKKKDPVTPLCTTSA